jgi:transposase-like protein
MAAPTTLQQAILFFSDYRNCHKAVSEIRWPDGVVRCPHCGSENVTYLENVRRWKCYAKHPKAQFSLKVGTIFEDSAIGLEKWLPALWLVTNCKNGISSYELARALGVTQKTAWFMLSRLRLALQAEHGGKLDGSVEVDETYIGGKARNMHAAKRKRLGMSQSRSMLGKVAVLGLLDRHGKDGTSQIRTAVVAGPSQGPSSAPRQSQRRSWSSAPH